MVSPYKRPSIVLEFLHIKYTIIFPNSNNAAYWVKKAFCSVVYTGKQKQAEKSRPVFAFPYDVILEYEAKFTPYAPPINVAVVAAEFITAADAEYGAGSAAVD